MVGILILIYSEQHWMNGNRCILKQLKSSKKKENSLFNLTVITMFLFTHAYNYMLSIYKIYRVNIGFRDLIQLSEENNRNANG